MYIHHHEVEERYVGRKQRRSDHLPPMLAQEMEFIMSLRGMNRDGWPINSNTVIHVMYVYTQHKVRLRYMYMYVQYLQDTRYNAFASFKKTLNAFRSHFDHVYASFSLRLALVSTAFTPRFECVYEIIKRV